MNAAQVIQLLFISAALAFFPRLLFGDEKPSDKKTPEQVFADLDKNGDGKLTADEISDDQKRHFRHLLRVAGKEEDGELTREEFLKGFKPDDLKVAAPQDLGLGRGAGQSDPNQIFQRFDRNKDGKVTIDEIPEPARPRFQPIFDRVQKKELTRDEFVKAVGQLRGGGFMQNPEGFFNRLDANHDGKLTIDEAPQQFRPMVERWFVQLRKSKDDSLTVDDLKKIVAENQAREEGRSAGRPPGPPPEFLRTLDTDGDGKLSEEELKKAVDRFDELDANHDGYLEPNELFAPPRGAGKFPGADSGARDSQAPAIKPGAAALSPRPSGQTISQAPADSDGRSTSALASRAGKRLAGASGNGKGALQSLDRDGDGRISRDEARGKLKRNFDAIDANGDGFLDRQEIRKALRDMGAR
ncbi:MAG TPA: EF-hand domain-containing protein [Planctomycetaceae bacterium]|nr:EF-hand domain-containing protein [Planctomycetaceae bacterium]